jgi:hypothetical protein
MQVVIMKMQQALKTGVMDAPIASMIARSDLSPRNILTMRNTLSRRTMKMAFGRLVPGNSEILLFARVCERVRVCARQRLCSYHSPTHYYQSLTNTFYEDMIKAQTYKSANYLLQHIMKDYLPAQYDDQEIEYVPGGFQKSEEEVGKKVE